MDDSTENIAESVERLLVNREPGASPLMVFMLDRCLRMTTGKPAAINVELYRIQKTKVREDSTSPNYDDDVGGHKWRSLSKSEVKMVEVH